jgi:diphthamide synthase (EF-2-diphthine--ammonia ligase)
VLLNEYFSTNHQALVTAIDKSKLDISYLAKMYDRDWIAKLPSGIDPMGENGEFHSFATFSPYFKKRIAYSKAIAIEDGPYTISTLKEP